MDGNSNLEIIGGTLLFEFLPASTKNPPRKDVYLNLPVTPWEAALGASVKIPTPLGKLDLKIPSNSSGGRKLRLKGQGIPGAPPGDIYVTLQITLPVADTDAAKKLYREMEQELAFNPRAHLGV